MYKTYMPMYYIYGTEMLKWLAKRRRCYVTLEENCVQHVELAVSNRRYLLACNAGGRCNER